MFEIGVGHVSVAKTRLCRNKFREAAWHCHHGRPPHEPAGGSPDFGGVITLCRYVAAPEQQYFFCRPPPLPALNPRPSLGTAVAARSSSVVGLIEPTSISDAADALPSVAMVLVRIRMSHKARCSAGGLHCSLRSFTREQNANE